MKIRVLLIILMFVIAVSGCGYLDEIKSSYEEDFNADEFEDFDFEEFEEQGVEGVEGETTTIEEGDIKEEEEKLVALEPDGEIEEVKEVESPLTKKFTEGDLVKLGLSATDPDGDPLTYTFTQPLDTKGEWQTKSGDAGEYPVTVTVSDGKSKVSQNILIIVEAANKAPVISLADVKAKEGEIATLMPTVTDPDGDEVTVSYSGWMTSNKYKTTYDDAGTHEVTVTASDGTKTTTKKINVVVENVDRAPILKSFDDVAVVEGGLVSLAPSYADPDGDDITVSYSEKVDAKGEWQTKAGDAGEYTVTVTVSDGKLSDSEKVRIIVQSLNKPPVLTHIADITVNEGEKVSFKPVASDPEGDEVTITYSGWMTSSSYTTTYKDAGTYTVTIKASDGKAETSQDVKVTVIDFNRPPVLVIS